MTTDTFYIIDFDSTFIKTEGLEELAAIALRNNPNKQNILGKIKNITNQGMEGTIPFEESLVKRLRLIQANQDAIAKTVRVLKRKISISVKRNKAFFKLYKKNIYIVSGGFKELVLPIIKSYGVEEDHVFANTFIFDKQKNVVGCDMKNPLSQANGKTTVIQSLKLEGEILMIGDGYSDYEVKKRGSADTFLAFTENVKRKKVTELADYILPSFDEFLFLNKLPMNLSYPKNRLKVLLLEKIDQQAVRQFEKEGYSVEYYEKSLEEIDLKKKIEHISLLGIRSRTIISKEVLSIAPHLIAIGAFCIGTDQTDLAAAAQKGIPVFNAPYSNTRSVVELVMGEIIMLMRNIFDKSIKLHAGVWDKSAAGSFEVRGKKLGIIGYGNIGSQLSVVAESMGMQVYFYDTVEKLALGNAKRCKTMKELLELSDVISIHVDGNKKNKNLISKKEFRLMKEGVVFINASRGFIIDINDLADALKSGKIKGAAIDVFPKEPKSSNEQFISVLRNMQNVILTPHIGGSTEEAQQNIAEYVSTKLIEYINTGSTYLSVNLPNIQLPKQLKSHRLLHLHRNVPGILAQINTVLSESGMNIIGQYLKTSEDVGYVITDVNKKYNSEVFRKLKEIPETIRFRTLY